MLGDDPSAQRPNELGRGALGPVFQPLLLVIQPLPTPVQQYPLRALLAGEHLDYEGPVVRLHGVSPGRQLPPAPVVLGALGPRMLRLAGEMADGAALNWCTPEQVAWSREQVAAGAARRPRCRRGAHRRVHPDLRR